MFKALGASPIPLMVPEITASMRAGIVDGLICPAGWYVGSQLYTITKSSVTCSKMRYVMGSMVVTQKAWNKIPEKYHKPIEKAILGLELGFNDALSGNESLYVDAMVKYGLKRVELTPSDIEAWKKKTRPMWDRLSGKLFPREVLDEVLGYLEEYRSKRVTSFHP
jgi:TRAP-type C4-dicarboxylate transport system substrate-binding protein